MAKRYIKRVLIKPYKMGVSIARKVVNLDRILEENVVLREKLGTATERLEYLEKDFLYGWPKGHYYSPVHKPEDLSSYKAVAKRSKGKFAEQIPGFSEKSMLAEATSLSKYSKDFSYPVDETKGMRFYTKNQSYPGLDAVVLFSMLRKYKPRRIIEIGSGHTSGLMMDVNDRFFDKKMSLTFIEPYTDTLYGRMQRGDKSKYKVIEQGVQDVSLDIFRTLKKDDVLFIDSTHVSKFNSDVNYELFDILPVLSKGVLVHVHDIFDGFEYPLPWLEDGWSWNEDYMMRAFLANNNDFEIILMNDYLAQRHPDVLKRLYPKDDLNILNGGSLWLRKL